MTVRLCEPYASLDLDPVQVSDILVAASGDIDWSFLFFFDPYAAVARNVSHACRIVDLGGAYGMQQAFFRDFAGYVDVDHDQLAYGWSANGQTGLPLRYVDPAMAGKVSHVGADIDAWLDEQALWHGPLDDGYVIVSAVPGAHKPSDVAFVERLVRMFPRGGLVWYPGQGPIAWGVAARDVLSDMAGSALMTA